MTASREIVFIDQNVFDLHSLLAGLRPDVEPIVLTASARATAQIATALKGRDDLHAIHIIAHGSAGEVRFGAGVLSRETLHDHAADLAEIGRALGRDGQLSLWSCETGQGKRGAAFVDALARATGADVAATVGLVGSAERGGRWELDSGFAQAPLTLEGMAAYAGVMQTHLDAFSLTAITDDVGPDDFLTNDHTLILHGTLDYRGADGTNQTTSFKIYLSGGEFGATPTYVGTFSFPPGTLPGDPSTTTTVDWSVNLQTLGVSAAQYLNDGTYTLLLVDASPSGGNLIVNEGGNNQFTIDSNIDLDPPTQTVVISSITDDVAPSIGTVADGGTTNDTAPALAGTLSAILGVGEVLSIFRDGVKIGVADVAGTNWTFSDAGPLVDGTNYTYTARVVDAANNLGPASNAYDITIDTSNPTAAVAITAIADDTGTAGDFTTSDTTLTVSGTHGALGAGEKVQVSSDGGTTWSDVTTSDATTWSFTDPTVHGASFTYQARVIDAAANVGNSDSQAVTIDTSVSSATVSITAIDQDTGTADDFKTSDTTLIVSGSNDALAVDEKIQISSDGGLTWSDVSQGTNTSWSFDDTGNPHPSNFTYDVRIIDAAANVGNTDSQAVTINDPAAAYDDAVATTENTIVTADVFEDNGFGADSNPDGFSVTSMSGGMVGTQLTLLSGALLTLNADGTLSYDPNHRFDYLPTLDSGASNLTVTDTFTYTTTGGNTATVTVTVSGVDSDDVLYDSAGIDTLAGGIGNDVYYVNNTDDVVIEAANAGIDIVGATVNYTLSENHNIEVLSMLGSGLTGTGSSGTDTLHSAGGPNTLIGLGGDDHYYVNNSADVVIEEANGGIDIVGATVNYTLSENHNIEALSMLGSGLTGTGSSGADTLHSGWGANTLVGLGGDDIYFVNNSADVVIEAANGGNDFVGATVDYTLSENHNIETLSMLGSGLTGTGSAGADTLHSNGGPNTLVGLGGDDVYYVNNTDDVVIEAANGGSDNVVATVDYTLPTNVEALYMIGSGLTGAGNSNDNWLVTLGANTLIGGAGNDVFQFSAGSANGATVADFTHDQVTEWDFLVFSGFGTGAQGATFSQIGNTDQWQIHSGLDGHNETITLGVGPLHAGDFVFV